MIVIKKFLKGYSQFLIFRLDENSNNILKYMRLNRFLICYIGTLIDIFTGIIIFAPIFTIYGIGISCVVNIIYAKKYAKEIKNTKETILKKIFIQIAIFLIYILLCVIAIIVVSSARQCYYQNYYQFT